MQLIENGQEKAHFPVMDRRNGVAESAGRWTRPDIYVEALARQRTARQAHLKRKGRTEPERPQLLMSTIPFLALISFLGILTVAIMVAAFPGTQPAPQVRQPAPREIGVAGKGWFQKAEKEFHQ